MAKFTEESREAWGLSKLPFNLSLTHPKRAPGQLRGAGPMLAGIVDRAYRTPTVPREREYKGVIVYVCVCMCAAPKALLYCLQYCLAVCGLYACVWAHSSVSRTLCHNVWVTIDASPLNRPAQHCVHFKKGQNTMSRAGRRDEGTHKAQWISVYALDCSLKLLLYGCPEWK